MVPPYSDRITRVPPYLSLAQYHALLFTYGAITHYGPHFQTVPLNIALSLTGSSNFARHYFRNLGWFLFLELLRCFSSLGLPHIPMYSVCDTPKGGFPHSDTSGSKLICQLPEAFRRLSRLSSPIIAKASTICSYSLDPITLTSAHISAAKHQTTHQGTYSRYLCRIQFAVLVKNFFANWNIRWRNQKLLLTARWCIKPLRMCIFRQQRWFRLYEFLKNSRVI